MNAQQMEYTYSILLSVSLKTKSNLIQTRTTFSEVDPKQYGNPEHLHEQHRTVKLQLDVTHQPKWYNTS